MRIFDNRSTEMKLFCRWVWSLGTTDAAFVKSTGHACGNTSLYRNRRIICS